MLQFVSIIYIELVLKYFIDLNQYTPEDKEDKMGKEDLDLQPQPNLNSFTKLFANYIELTGGYFAGSAD